jgi:hypothetical protein
VKELTEAVIYGRIVLIRVVVLSLSVLASATLFSQKATRQTAVTAFDRNDNNEALRQFTELSSTYPKDPLYKYYCGVCLVKLEREPSRASSLLNDAVTGSTAIRTIPEDGLFWLGRAQQMSGKFPEAIGSFEKYSSLTGKKMAKEMNVPEYIKQCQEKKGMVEETVLPAEAAAVIQPVEKTSETVSPVTVTTPVILKPVPPEDPSAKYDSLLAVALKYQLRSDSITTMAEKLRVTLASTEGNAKNDLRIQVQNLDNLSLESRRQADAAIAEARKLAGTPVVPDSAVAEPQVAQVTSVTDTAAKVNPVTAPVPEVKGKEIFSEFEVVEKPVFQPGEKVTVNPDVPAGLIYRIQVAVFRNPVAPSYFKGIKPVHGFRNGSTGITTYYAGMFRKSADASKALSRVRGLGFKDSFVSPLMDKKTVSADRAALLEKEWGGKPLYTVKPAEPDTVPQTLIFRVEIKRSPKPLPADQVEIMKKMAGARGFDVIVTEKKVSVYLAGKFLTFVSASEYADLLVRNGYRDSKVVAYLGNREIPVETARQLFEEH